MATIKSHWSSLDRKLLTARPVCQSVCQSVTYQDPSIHPYTYLASYLASQTIYKRNTKKKTKKLQNSKVQTTHTPSHPIPSHPIPSHPPTITLPPYQAPKKKKKKECIPLPRKEKRETPDVGAARIGPLNGTNYTLVLRKKKKKKGANPTKNTPLIQGETHAAAFRTLTHTVTHTQGTFSF
ncbi:hypothetical protein EJ05DRAFT_130828 [Pseudovirgaria hyperparasitica]|uniref:Uncharacterized protein n=1 Tax=Pseudovirgaria hyperparasitica TaxID=470096 RepID=A0A6A6VVJ9_9PEZI|nr:uncharacterized protein EJ05DRAFT_130828 [Pseudovirgaria hyperparasitica]KAF2754708.1 hypothetical protein EJ05DRAFT_130828 [Pseudovirgaria hyperparasitica]